MSNTGLQPGRRDPGIDALRGLMLLWMAVDHAGGSVAGYTYQALGFFSAAEVFFFLSGFVGGSVARNRNPAFLRRRAAMVYAAHLGTFVFLLAASVVMGAPKALEESLQHPLYATLLAALLLHMPDYLDVLPLYAVFLAVAPAWLGMIGRRGWAALALPVCLWALQWTGMNWSGARAWLLPAWIGSGSFELFAWFLPYALGSLVGRLGWPKWPDHWMHPLLVLIALVLGFLLVWKQGWLKLGPPPSSWVDRESLGWLRLINFVLFAWLVHGIYSRWAWFVRFWKGQAGLALLGRHTLPAFSIHIPVVYAILACREAFPDFRAVLDFSAFPLVLLLFGIAYGMERQKRRESKKKLKDFLGQDDKQGCKALEDVLGDQS